MIIIKRTIFKIIIILMIIIKIIDIKIIIIILIRDKARERKASQIITCHSAYIKN